MHELDLSHKNQKTGVSKRANLTQVYKQSGVMPVELEPRPIPDAGVYIYEMFWDLFSRDGFRWQDVYYYQKIYDIELSGEELNILRRLSVEANEFLAKKDKPASAGKSPAPKRGK